MTNYLILMIVIIMLVWITNQGTRRKRLLKQRKKRGIKKMSNALLKEYVGKDCQISSGNYAVSVKGKILRVQENWLELQTKKEVTIINTDFIDSIKIK